LRRTSFPFRSLLIWRSHTRCKPHGPEYVACGNVQKTGRVDNCRNCGGTPPHSTR
jgi:hypothetical protein